MIHRLHSRRSNLGALTALLLTAMLSVSAQAVTLEQEMTKKEFEAAGLDKLTAEELERLNAYLGREREDLTQEFGSEHLEKEERAEEVELIEARIVGPFDGWDGKTYFRLDNGQVWQQRVSGNYRKKAENPEVVVEKGRFGYYLRLKGESRSIGVKRLK